MRGWTTIRQQFLLGGDACSPHLQFVPPCDASVAVQEMRRVVRPRGVVAAYVWDYVGRMELLRHFWDSAIALDPAAASLHEGARFPICDPGELARLFRDAGLEAALAGALWR